MMKPILIGSSMAPKNAFSTFLLVAVLFCSSFIAGNHIERIINERSINQMMSAVRQGARDVSVMVDSTEQQMTIMATMLAALYPFSEDHIREHLHQQQAGMLLSAYSVLFPDNHMVYAPGRPALMSIKTNFYYERDRGPSFYSRHRSIPAKYGHYSVFTYPIKVNGEVKAILFGYVNLEEVPQKLQVAPFAGQAALYLVDGKTGDMLVDTWHHNVLGNFLETSLRQRQSIEGRSFKDIKEDAFQELEGYGSFVSNTIGEPLMLAYSPVGKHKLTFTISIPKSVVFADAILIKRINQVLALIMMFLTMCYIVLQLRQAYLKSALESERTELSIAIAKAQTILLQAYENSTRLNESLSILAQDLQASHLILVICKNKLIQEIYGSKSLDPELGKHYNNTPVPDIILPGFPHKTTSLYSITLQKSHPEEWFRIANFFGIALHETVIKNMVITRCTDSSSNITSIIYAFNVHNPMLSREGLETLAMSFSQAIKSMEDYKDLQGRGELDALTGLKNRNAYQRDLLGYDKQSYSPLPPSSLSSIPTAHGLIAAEVWKQRDDFTPTAVSLSVAPSHMHDAAPSYIHDNVLNQASPETSMVQAASSDQTKDALASTIPPSAQRSKQSKELNELTAVTTSTSTHASRSEPGDANTGAINDTSTSTVSNASHSAGGNACNGAVSDTNTSAVSDTSSSAGDNANTDVVSNSSPSEVTDEHHSAQNETAESGAYSLSTALPTQSPAQPQEVAPGMWACIYIDVNGLHDLNNTCGHNSGDIMLKTIARLIRKSFGFASTYRIGGDEFVVISQGRSAHELDSILHEMQIILDADNYHISSGYALIHKGEHIHQALLNAETMMYENKRAYYASGQAKRNARQRNETIESVLKEKGDHDAFLQVISHYFLASYLVDLDQDQPRIIYTPINPLIKLKEDESHQRFLRTYSELFFTGAARERFLEFTNYARIKQALAQGQPLEYYFVRNDGMRLHLRIMPTPDYSESKCDTIWIYERSDALDPKYIQNQIVSAASTSVAPSISAASNNPGVPSKPDASNNPGAPSNTGPIGSFGAPNNYKAPSNTAAPGNTGNLSSPSTPNTTEASAP